MTKPISRIEQAFILGSMELIRNPEAERANLQALVLAIEQVRLPDREVRLTYRTYPEMLAAFRALVLVADKHRMLPNPTAKQDSIEIEFTNGSVIVLMVEKAGDTGVKEEP